MKRHSTTTTSPTNAAVQQIVNATLVISALITIGCGGVEPPVGSARQAINICWSCSDDPLSAYTDDSTSSTSSGTTSGTSSTSTSSSGDDSSRVDDGTEGAKAFYEKQAKAGRLSAERCWALATKGLVDPFWCPALPTIKTTTSCLKTGSCPTMQSSGGQTSCGSEFNYTRTATGYATSYADCGGCSSLKEVSGGLTLESTVCCKPDSGALLCTSSEIDTRGGISILEWYVVEPSRYTAL